MITQESRKSPGQLAVEETVIKSSPGPHDVTVIIPHYEAKEFCIQAIASIDSGTFALEILVIDDGSSHEQFEALKNALKETDHSANSMRLIRKQNQGAYLTRLQGVGWANATFVKFLDQDDLLIPGVLEKEIALAIEKEVDVVLTDWEENWPVQNSSSKAIQHSAPDYTDPVFGFLTVGGVFTSAALYRRRVFDKIQPVTGWLPKLSDDWVIFGQVLLEGARYWTWHQTSYQWRHHDTQLSRNSPIGHAQEFYFFLPWIEDRLRQNNQLKETYAHALATYMTKNAIFLCYHDATKWSQIATRVTNLDPNFDLWDGHGKWMILLVRGFGLNYGVKIYVFAKKMFASNLINESES